jgi:hypothetical protein
MGLKCPKCGSTKRFYATRFSGGSADVTVDGNNEVLEEDDPDLNYDDPEGRTTVPSAGPSSVATMRGRRIRRMTEVTCDCRDGGRFGRDSPGEAIRRVAYVQPGP